MRIAPVNQRKQNQKTNFTAIYAKDSAYFENLKHLIAQTQPHKKGKESKEVIRQFLGNELLEKYESLLFIKGICFTYANRFFGDIFLNNKEEKLIRKLRQNIGDAVHNKESSDTIINQKLILFEELKKIVENAKPISTKRINNGIERLNTEINKAKTKAMNNLFN